MMKFYMITLTQICKLCKFIILIVIIASCSKTNNKTTYYSLDKKYMFVTLVLHNFFDDYYLTYDHYPKNMKELISNFNIEKDSLYYYYFEDPFHKGKIIKYVPVFEKDSIYPSEYFITSANSRVNYLHKNNLDTLYKIFDKFYKDTITTEKPVIYDYSNKLLVRSAHLYRYHMIILNNEIKENQFFHLIFDISIDDYKIINNQIIVNKKDNIIVGKLFSNRVKEKINKKKWKKLKLIGFKYKYSNDTLFLKNVKLYFKKQPPGFYYDEIGNLIKKP